MVVIEPSILMHEIVVLCGIVALILFDQGKEGLLMD
jgi:hypothetical protein